MDFPERLHVKMCGMMRRSDILHAAALGVDAIGVIFYPKSPRAVSIGEASLLLKELPLFMSVVAVMVNPTVHEVLSILAELPVHALQFHGEETPEFCAQFNKPFIKAIPATHRDAITLACSTYDNAAAILLDTPSVTLKGGTGQTFDWQCIPVKRNKSLILSGGLTSDNVAQAVSTVHPFAIDVCSGIEQLPGIKDHTKMDKLMKALFAPG